MTLLLNIFDFFLHLDTHLGAIISNYGVFTYWLLFLVLFAETGLVVTPFLPGDSLIFVVGSFAAQGIFNFFGAFLLLWSAAFLGDTANYFIGRFLGQKIIDNPRIPVNQEHIDRAQKFYDQYGGKTIFLARFIPLMRTFAPFVAGVGKMNYQKFVFYNLFGGLVWVLGFMTLGYFFGNIPQVKENFSLAILLIVFVSISPVILRWLAGLIKAKNSKK